MEYPPRRIELPDDSTGALYVMPRPSPDRLHDDIHQLRSLGVDHIVSLLGEVEFTKLGLSCEAEACQANEISFTNHPIADFGVPEPDAFRQLADTIKGWLDDGRHVVIHCRAGVGRSGTLACCVLQLFGATSEAAMASVSAARGVQVPETEDQRRFVRTFLSADD